MRDIGVIAGGVREYVPRRDGVGRPDDLTHSEVPPHVGVVEAPAHRHHGQSCEKRSEHYREREDPSQGVNTSRTAECLDRRTSCGHALSTSGLSESKPRSESASESGSDLIKRCRYAREMFRLRAASVLFPLFSRRAVVASLTL